MKKKVRHFPPILLLFLCSSGWSVTGQAVVLHVPCSREYIRRSGFKQPSDGQRSSGDLLCAQAEDSVQADPEQ